MVYQMPISPYYPYITLVKLTFMLRGRDTPAEYLVSLA